MLLLIPHLHTVGFLQGEGPRSRQDRARSQLGPYVTGNWRFRRIGDADSLKFWWQDVIANPSGLTATHEPEGVLWRAGPGYLPGIDKSDRINATLLALVRNEELDGMLQAMGDLERTWNHKFNYPWTFFNDVAFSEEFKRKK